MDRSMARWSGLSMPVTRRRPRRAGAVLAAAWALGAAAPAAATFPGINGDLVYNGAQGGIATVPLGGLPDARPDIGRESPITAAGALARDAHWSPDGSEIVYSSAES